MIKTLRKAVVAVISAGALFCGSAAAAVAAEDGATKPASIVDASKTGNIHLTKYDNGTGQGDQALTDGTQHADGIKGKTVQGI
ncbi:MAG: hypothetical protein SPI12_01525 [Actinomycetaceae bacterium]|nr:hypothetical protein [Actinomycetaceae bacterium]MDY6082527.1 hypothetical protein [Actinomycetaceae bacterium]